MRCQLESMLFRASFFVHGQYVVEKTKGAFELFRLFFGVVSAPSSSFLVEEERGKSLSIGGHLPVDSMLVES